MSAIHCRFSKKKYSLPFFVIVFLTAAMFLPAEGDKLTIQAAVQAALVRNERAAVADEKVKASNAQVLKARSFFLPTITATGTYTRRPDAITRTLNDQSVTVQSLNALAATVAMNLNLFDSRSIPLFRQVKLENKAEKCNSLENKRALSFEVCNAFLATLGVEQMLNAAQKRFDLAKKNLEAAQARFEAQLVSVNDVTRAQLEYATAERNITRAQGDVQSARLQLEFLLDQKIAGELVIPESLLAEAQSPPSMSDALIPEAQGQRLDLRSLRWHARAQHAYAVEPLLRWLPNLALIGSYRFTNESGLSGKSSTWSVGLNLNWTIFDGLTRIADYSERKALAHIADLEFKAGERQVELQVHNAQVTLTNQQASLKQAAVAQEVAGKNAGETTELYRQGLTGALQAADANVSLYEAEVELIRARYGIAVAFLNLRSAMGLDPFGNHQIK